MNPFRILVVRLGAMGDVIHALPAVASLKRGIANAHVTWVIRPRWAALLEGNPDVDEIIPYERTMAGVNAVRRQVRAQRFHLVVDLQGLIQSALIARAARADRVIGFDGAAESLAAQFYSQRVATTSTHVVDQNLELAAAAGASPLIREFRIAQGSPEGELPEGRFVLASPLAGWSAKEWPLDRFAALADRIDMPLVVNGPASAIDTLRQIRGAHVHTSGIAGLIDATRRAHAVVGVDSGPLHLAAALAKPGVAIYGATDPARNGPYGGSLRVLRSVNAITTYKRDASDADMRAISVDAVIEALAAVSCPA